MTVVDYINTKRAITVDLRIEQGSDIDIPVTVLDSAGDPRDFSGYSARIHVRPYIDSDDVLLELTSGNGKITVASNSITLHFVNTDLVGVDWMDGEYDLEIVSATGKVERIMQGHFTVDLEVTRN